jgi:hypothetical protein
MLSLKLALLIVPILVKIIKSAEKNGGRIVKRGIRKCWKCDSFVNAAAKI